MMKGTPTMNKSLTSAVTLTMLVLAGCGSGISQETLTAATTRAADAEKAVTAAQDATAVAERKLATAQTAATEAAAKAKKAAESALTTRSNAVAGKEAALLEREKKVGLAESEAAANTFSGDGTFIVGDDVKPGTYKSAGGVNCYWVRNDKGGDIIANDLGDGPTVIVIGVGDFSVTARGCEPFTKTGG